MKRLRAAFRAATAGNDPENVGLMNAAQLATAGSALATDLGVSTEGGLSEIAAADAIAKVEKCSPHHAAGAKPIDFNGRPGASKPGHIEFSQFVMVCVNIIGPAPAP